MEVIFKKNIRVAVEVESWQCAIEAAGSILVQNNDIKEEYVEAMIEAVNKLGPYIVLSPGFALAHAEPSEYVLNNSMSLITLKNPVSFGSVNDPVNVVLCLACTDNTSHIETLKTVASKLIIDGTIERMAKCSTDVELYELINN